MGEVRKHIGLTKYLCELLDIKTKALDESQQSLSVSEHNRKREAEIQTQYLNTMQARIDENACKYRDERDQRIELESKVEELNLELDKRDGDWSAHVARINNELDDAKRELSAYLPPDVRVKAAEDETRLANELVAELRVENESLKAQWAALYRKDPKIEHVAMPVSVVEFRKKHRKAKKK
jgi:hypothetical protein